RMAVQSFNAFYFVFIIAIVVGLSVLLSRLYKPDNLNDRRKILWILWGMVIGLPPLLFLNGVAQIRGIKVPHALAMTVGLLSLLFPTAFGYAIVKHRVMDVGVALRRSVKYFLASRMVQILEAIILATLLFYLLVPVLQSYSSRLGLNGIVVN